MKSNGNHPNGLNKSISYFMNTKNWWGPLTFIFIISVLGVGMIGFQTYNEAPPLSSFKTKSGQLIIDKAEITKGQLVFHKYNLMEYGSFFGDGAQRGPDFTAEALHQVTKSMNDYNAAKFKQDKGTNATEFDIKIIEEFTKNELKQNTYQKQEDVIYISDAMAYAFGQLKNYYTDLFFKTKDIRAFLPANYISERADVSALSAFFFWGAWVFVTERPGSNFSYTHNWPFDPSAGNTPTSPVILWSVLGLLGFVLTCGIVYILLDNTISFQTNSLNPPPKICSHPKE